MSGFDENEISKNANGGTEITKRSLQSVLPQELLEDFQIIPSRARDLNQDKIRIYQIHDLAEDPELSHLRDENSRNRFHMFSFVTNWQLNDFVTKLEFPQDEKVIVLENPIVPSDYNEKPKDRIDLVYFSTPQRGLEILVPVFEELSKNHDNIHLHVYSSFMIYGWKELDNKFQPLYDRIKNHSKMTYHGYKPQQEVLEDINKYHILAFPSIWKETSCRVLMESMSAGLMCVHPNLAALSETSGGLTSMYQFHDDHNKHASIFYQYLDNAIKNVNKDEAQKYLKFVKANADTRFNINKIAQHWEVMLRELKNKYPTVESRRVPSQVFVYKTS